MENLQVIALTHKDAPLELVGRLHIDEASRSEKLGALKEALELQEIAFLSTCNRVEFIISSDTYFCKGRQHQLLDYMGVTGEDKAKILGGFKAWHGEEAMRHLLEVSSSLDSMILGEREIITQVRKAFEDARSWNLSGDMLRLVQKNLIETAKHVFTETNISTRPVSVVSLAYKAFENAQFSKDTSILLIGAGQTNSNFARFLAKQGYSDVTIANRTLEKAKQALLIESWEAVQLYHIPQDKDFKVVVTCTGSEEPIVTSDFLQGFEKSDRFMIDMALPADVSVEVQNLPTVKYIGMTQLQSEAEANLAIRREEVDKCQDILDEAMEDFRTLVRQREIELAMREIPSLIKNIKDSALGEVFAKDLEGLDEHSKEILEKIIGYMEKKYISVPMKLAREVMLEKTGKN